MNKRQADLTKLEIVPVRVVLPNGQRIDEAYERSIMLADIRKDLGFREDEVDFLINGEYIDESTRIADLKLHYCRDRVHIYFLERKDEESKSKKREKEEIRLKKPSPEQLHKIVRINELQIISDQFELQEKYNFRRYVSNYKRKVYTLSLMLRDLRGVARGPKTSIEDMNGYSSREQKFLTTRAPLFHPCVQLGARCFTRKRMLENYNPAEDLKPRRVSPEQFINFLFLIRVCVVLLIFELDSYQLWLLQFINLAAEVYFLINKVKKIYQREQERLLSILQTRFQDDFREELDMEVAEFRQHIFGEEQQIINDDLHLDLLLNSIKNESGKGAAQSFEEIREKVVGAKKQRSCLRAVWQTVFYFFYSMHYGAMENEFQRFEKQEKEQEELMKRVEDAWKELEEK